MSERGSDFAHIVYTLLVVEKLMTVDEVAAALGMSYAVLHSRMIARSAFSADEIRGLLRILPEPRLVSYLLEGTKFIAADRTKIDSGQADLIATSIQRGATKVVVEAAEILELVDASLAGGGIDHRSKRVMLKDISEAERALASLRVRIEDV